MSKRRVLENIKHNQNELKKLRTCIQFSGISQLHHSPSNPENLPKLEAYVEPNTLKEDEEELQLIKILVLKEKVPLDIFKFRSLKGLLTRSEIVDHYKYKSCYKSNFRLNDRHEVSYRNGYFYDIMESASVILNINHEVIPLIKTSYKTLTDDEITTYSTSNSINILSSHTLKPEVVTIHTPHI
nr:hypothetical protein MmNV_50 [Menippe mercenaria nudivirus]